MTRKTVVARSTGSRDQITTKPVRLVFITATQQAFTCPAKAERPPAGRQRERAGGGSLGVSILSL